MVRKTRQRDAIKSIFVEQPRPLTPQEVLDGAKLQVPGLGIATVYRTINGLLEEGFLAPIDIPGQSTCYEVAGLKHHHHFHCDACERTYDVEGCPASLSNIDLPGFTVDRHDVIFYGRCQSCN
jgi:Fur family ferric uptake transcriptional regulator